jgi:AP-1 complex subunit mu
MDEIIDFGFP